MHRIPCAKGEQAWKATRGKVAKYSLIVVKTKAIWPPPFFFLFINTLSWYVLSHICHQFLLVSTCNLVSGFGLLIYSETHAP